MSKRSDITQHSFRGTLTSNEILTIVASLEKEKGEQLKDSLRQLLFLISTSPEGQRIEGGQMIIDQIVKIFCTLNESEIQALCLSILLNFNSKSGLAVNDSHIQTLYASLIQTIHSADETISESATYQLIQAVKKLPEFKQFLVQRSGFLKKTTEILLQENSSSSSSSQQIVSNDHVKSAFLDIIIQLTLQKNLKWNQIELIELINALEVISGSEERQLEEDSLEAKAQQLLPLLKMKISKQGKESKQQNCDECQKLGEELIRNEEQKRIIEEES
ncbi:MAG: hypothetical protein EZS28_018452 [Streblomastix strix]|uniref:Uncharacterized protein n=1 Tax=Streblomastix strix TaxID=222440 RepID=A0A5J4VTR6_9EUKA|nr:MAG: hypothetical protein EZS28_018452 [Streblomastix strix]